MQEMKHQAIELIETLWNVNFFKESKYVDEEMN